MEASSPTGGSSQDAEGAKSEVSSGADPRDLVSFSPIGEGQTVVTFDSYDQLRDYADVAALVRVEKVAVAEPFTEPYVLPGELDVVATVVAPLGGRSKIRGGERLTFVLPLQANESQMARYGDHLDHLQGLEVVFFAWRRIWSDRPDTYEPIRRGAPNSVLAMWPDSGRLAAVAPHDYLAEDAVKEGERLTGTSSPPYPEWQPTFRGPDPIGMTAKDLDRFANIEGDPVTVPAGWDQLEPSLAPPAG